MQSVGPAINHASLAMRVIVTPSAPSSFLKSPAVASPSAHDEVARDLGHALVPNARDQSR